MRRWLAALQDAHTAVQRVPRPQPLPYAARLYDGKLLFADVPAGTPAAHAGISLGDEIVGVDVSDVWERSGAPSQLRPWLVGGRVLSCAPDTELCLEVRRRDGSHVELVSGAGDTWPQPLEARRLESGTAYLRIRRWLTEDEDLLDAALDELSRPLGYWSTFAATPAGCWSPPRPSVPGS